MKKELIDALKKPFHASEIEWMITAMNREKTQGLAVPFVSNRAIQNRLDEVFGIDGWQNDYKPWRDIADKQGTVTGSQLCGISAYDEDRQEWITKWDGASDTDIEPIKGGLSASMKRAAGMWGIGRYLYDVESTWVDVESYGKSYRIARGCEPALPSWALPEGEKNQATGHAYQTPQPQAIHSPPQKKTPQTTTQTPQTGKKLTERQINRAYVKGKMAGMTEADVEQLSLSTYRVPVADLSKSQYDDFCAHLDTLA